jgi:hypothetical protein
MPTPIAPVITDAGLAAALAADGLGLSLQITHGVLSPNAFTPTGASTQADKREIALVASGAKVGNQVNITINWRASDYTGAAYNVGSIGFYAGDPATTGILFAVISAPDRASPSRGGGNVANYTQTYTLTLSGVPEGSVSVSIDPDATVAMAALSAHIAATNPHTQYVRKAGDTMTGALVLHGNAVSPLEAVPLQQLSSAATHEALIALNGWCKTPIQSPAGGFLIDQWCRVYLGNPPNGASALIIPFIYPIPMDGFIGAVVSTIGGVSTAIRVTIENATLTGADVVCEEMLSFTQNATAQVFIRGYIGPDVPAGLIPSGGGGGGGGDPIVAAFTVSFQEAFVGETFTFTDTSAGTPTSWYWDFGDGTTSDLQNPTKAYSSVGTYSVSLTASKIGSFDTEMKLSYIQVEEST